MDTRTITGPLATMVLLAAGWTGGPGGARALLGGLLRVKPILTNRDGRVEPLEQQRITRRALIGPATGIGAARIPAQL